MMGTRVGVTRHAASELAKLDAESLKDFVRAHENAIANAVHCDHRIGRSHMLENR